MNALRRTMDTVVLIGLGLLMGGCPWTWPVTADGAGGTGLRRFGSPDELLQYLRQRVRERATQRDTWMFWGATPSADTIGAAGSEGGAQGEQSSESTSYSTTNIQEAGVDESDVVKSDGTRFYIAKGKTLRIVQAVPFDQMKELGRIELQDYVSELYLLGTQVIVLAEKYPSGGYLLEGQTADYVAWPPYQEQASVVVYAIDVTDPAAPAVVGKNELDGSLVSSRLTNGQLILVLTFVPSVPSSADVFSLSAMSLDDVLPKQRTSAGEDYLVPPEDWYRPESPDGYYVTAVVTLDASNLDAVRGAVAVMANADTIYASTEAVYTTGYMYDDRTPYEEKTAIHKFAFDDQGVARYVGSGAVPGALLNQFSLSEYQGYLRVATHVSNANSELVTSMTAVATSQTGLAGQSYNGVYVLGQNGAALEVVGKVEGIAPAETLYAARFLGNHGFLVTYRKVDPLFVLELSDPTQPKVLGELKVPGFSEYLHPLDDTHLIGVGKYSIADESDTFDWYQGVQLSLFDVSDWANPKAIQQLTFGGRGSQCEVSQTHKAFAFLSDSNLLALPMQLTTLNDIPWEYGDPEFDGVIVFRVDPATGFTELGRLDNVGEISADYYWSSTWHRAALIGNAAYALTTDGIRAVDIEHFDTPSTLILEPAAEETGGSDEGDAVRVSGAGADG